MPHLDEHGKPQPGPGPKPSQTKSWTNTSPNVWAYAVDAEDIVSQRDRLRAALDCLVAVLELNKPSPPLVAKAKRFAEKVLADTVPK